MLPLIFGLRGAQLIVVVLVVLLLFGVNQIPKIMRNLGKGVHSFKQGLEDAKEEINKEVKKADTSASDSTDKAETND